jgi:fructosamine-3-kinase
VKTCPSKPFNSLKEALSFLFDEVVGVLDEISISGGDINQAGKLSLDNGHNLFIKRNLYEKIELFKCEISGLTALGKSGLIGVPQVLAYGFDRGKSFLLLPHIQSSVTNCFWKELGQNLATLHKTDRGEKFGFHENNFIGSNHQINDWKESWVDFFRICRLEYQINLGKAYFDSSLSRQILSLLDKLDLLLPEPEYPSLLHGDLWKGNIIHGDRGIPWIIDPAVYYGHFEADLAMTELFGTFHRDFYHAYREENPLSSGYGERRDLYNLYHLLNHLNMFGPSYLSSVESIIKRYV